MIPEKIARIVDWVMLIAVVFLSFLCVAVTKSMNDKANEIENYKLQLDQTQSQVYERQLKYEQEKDVSKQLEQDLADAQERLAQATERERAAQVRASRSRQSRIVSSSVSDQSRPQALPGTLSDITMYCPTGSRTASGKWPTVGMVATISRSIPFGTHVLIDGLGEYVVEDRIGSGSQFDIFTQSCGKADQFGRQHRRVTIFNTD